MFCKVLCFCRLQSLRDMTPMSWPSAGIDDVMQLHGGWLVHSRHTPDPPGPTARAAETAAGLRLAPDARVKTKHDQLFIHTQLFTPARSTSCLSPRPRSPASSNSPVFNKSGVEMRKIINIYLHVIMLLTFQLSDIRYTFWIIDNNSPETPLLLCRKQQAEAGFI